MKTSMPLDAWPEADRAMWHALRRQGGLFDDYGALAHLRESSAQLCMRPYGRWLTWIALFEPAALAEPPAERATRARLQAWLEALVDLQPTSKAMYFTAVLRIVSAAAPEADWRAHRKLKQRLHRAAAGGNPLRKQGRILSSEVLLQAADQHATEPVEGERTPLERAKRQRDGTMMAFLAMIPIRHRAMAGLDIGDSLLVSPSRVTVVLPPELTKSGVPWEADVPEPVLGLLRHYLNHVRPFLMARGAQVHDMLWVGNNGNPMGYSYIGSRIPDITEGLTGLRIPPHFFRDSAATTLARDSRLAAGVIGPVLGHTNHRTAEKHYIQAGSVEAGRDYAAVVRALRKKGGTKEA